MKRLTELLSILLLSAALAACGGGGGGSKPPGNTPPGNNPPGNNPPANKAPVATIAALGEQLELATITLDGSASSDADKDALTYQWKQTAGTAVALDAANTAKPTFRAPKVVEQETLTFELAVSDGKGGSDKETVDVIIKEGNVVVFKLYNNAYESDAGNGTEELYLVADSLGVPLRLSAEQESNHHVYIHGQSISPDRRHVAFTANFDSEEDNELYVSSLQDGSMRKVSGEMTNENGDVVDFAWSPDGQWIAYRSDSVRDNVYWLHTVRLADDARFTLGGLPEDEDPSEESEVSDYVWRPQGDLVVRGGWGTDGYSHQLYLVAPDVENDIQYPMLTSAIDFDVTNYALSPDGTHVAWILAKENDWHYFMALDIDAFLSPSGASVIDFSEAMRDLNGNQTWDSDITAFEWSPDSQHLALFANMHAIEGQPGNDFTGCGRVYRAAINDPANPETVVQRLNGDDCFREFQFSPGGEHLAVRGAFTSVFPDLYRLYVDGQAESVGITDSYVESMSWSPDGAHIAFVADLITAGRTEVFLWSRESDEQTLLSYPAQDGEFVLPGLRWSPDSSAVAYGFFNSGVTTLHTASLDSVDGSGETQLYDQSVSNFHWTMAVGDIVFASYDATCNCNSLLLAARSSGEIRNLSVAVQDRDADGTAESQVYDDFIVPGVPAPTN